jgi:RHS repeat-associated protein
MCAPLPIKIADLTHHTYDNLDRLTQTLNADSGIEQFTPNALDQTTRVIDPANQATTHTVNALGDVTQTVSADTGTTVRTYDEAGNLKTEKDARNVTVSYTYDALNRLSKQQSSQSGSPVYTYGYDSCGKGRLCWIQRDGAFHLYFSYDPHGRMNYQLRAIPGDTWYYSLHNRDAYGRPSQIVYPSGRSVATAYDAHGRISQISTQKTASDPVAVLAGNFNYSYPFAGPLSFLYGNGKSFYQSRDQDYRPAYHFDGPRYKLYSHDEAGSVKRIADIGNTQFTYAYDATGRLVSALDSATNSFGSLAWTYDKNGNRQSETRNAGTMPYVYSPPGSNWLYQRGSDSRSKTAIGNTASISGVATFTYDGFNRLATSQTAAETTTYTYNALGQRIKKRNQNGLQTVFHYGQNGELLYERDASGNSKEYVWLEGRPLARIDNGTAIYYYHVDHLGTPQAMTNSAGTTVWKADYEPFGKATIKVSTIENNLRLPGQYYDRETGLHQNYFRDYEPTTGRYVETDPIGLDGGLNLYSYANQNPLTFTDPLGLAPYNDPMNQIANGAAGLPPNANLPPPLQCKKVCKAKVKVCVGPFEAEVSSGPNKWAGGYLGLRVVPGLSAQSGLECSIECGDPTGWNLKASATAGAGIGATGNASVGIGGVSTGGGLASGSIWGISLPSPGVGYKF